MKFSDFGFQENPFSITPDPRYLFLSRGHEESLAHLIYGTGPNGGFVQLTGEVGTGKTMLVRSLLEQNLGNVDIALVLNPRLSRRDFMAAICDELGVSYQGPPYMLKQLSDDLSQHLLKTHGQGRHTVLVIDEAQNLSPRVLEQIRLLTNLETSRHKLLRIILVGQPELQQLLARKDLRQVDQRITARYHLSPLCREETARYIRHRLTIAGVGDDLFTPSALKLVYYITGGVPRRINTLCERALLAVFTSGSKKVSMRMVWRASREIKGRYGWKKTGQWVIASLLMLTSAGVAWWVSSLVDPQNSTTDTLAGPVEDIVRITKSTQEKDLGQLDSPKATEVLSEIVLSNEQKQSLSMSVANGSPLLVEAATFDEPGTLKQQTLHQKLFQLWGRTVGTDVEQDICHQAMLMGLRCLSGLTNWEGLMRLDRPFLCQLKMEDLAKPVLVKKMRAEELLVDVGDGEVWIGKNDFIEQWEGAFVMLWRPPPGGALIGPGSSGVVVTWLRERLSLADAQPVPSIVGVDQFDDELKVRLQRFQRAGGLTADGIAGAWTMILLNNLHLPTGTPTLKGSN